MVHAECCGPGFYFFFPGGHSADEIARHTGNVTRNTESEAYPNAFRLSPGANYATNNPEYAAAAGAGPGVHGIASPGVRGDDLAACLAGLGSRAVMSGWITETVQAQEVRQVQMQAYSGEKRPPAFYNPSAAASNWTPPYAYTPNPSQITRAPAIFSHPD